ncbi:Pet127-domain-containing protein, partial [Hyaloscypha hepaticicola]
MFVSLSRGSSRVRQAYICSSCLSNALTHAPPGPWLTADRARRAVSLYSTTSDAQPTNNDVSDPVQTPNTESTKHGKSAGAADRVDGKKAKKGRKSKGGKISSSAQALKALRNSLALAAEVENGRKIEQLKSTMPQGKAAVGRLKRETKKLGVAQGKKEKKIVETKEPNKNSAKTKKAAPKAPLKGNKSEGSASEESKPLVRRMRRKQKVKETKDPGESASEESRPLKVIEYRSQNSVTVRRSLVALVQTEQFSAKERAIVMKLLKGSMMHKHFVTTSEILATREAARELNRRNDAVTRRLKELERSPRPLKQLVRRVSPTATSIQRAQGPISAKAGTTEHEIKTIEASELELIPIDNEPLEVPNLAYGLERVLFNPGVYHLQDPRSRVFNFDPYLQTIMPVSEFDFNALKQYITSSRDKTLLLKAKKEEKKYTGSTSSMTSALGHFHFLLSQWRPITTGNLSQMFPVEYNTFTALQRGPVAVFLRWRDGTYAIDADKQYDDSNILMMLGKSMEKLLTLSTDDFEKYRKANSDQISEEQRNEAEPFHYTTMGDFLMRSQLDAHDPRLPGTGMFDLKTRAVVSVRMDTSAFEEGRGYQIRGRHGEWESFEREYYDMIRSAFLKYSLQVRMGRMDGIFVAFHNTERIFGFQYISLPEMDYALHGTENTAIGDSEFKLSLELLNRVLDRATAKFPKQTLRLHFETRDGVTPFMYIFAEPVEEKVVEKIQATNKRKIERFEREVLGISTEKLTAEQKEAEWASLRAKVEERLQQDELGIETAADDAEAETGADLDEVSVEEQQKAIEILATMTIEDGEGDEGNDDDEDQLIEESDNDEQSLEEEEMHDEESDETALEDGDDIMEDSALDEQSIFEETIADDAEEPDESLEKHDVNENDIAEEHLSDDVEEMEHSARLEDQDFEEQVSTEDIVAQDLEEAERLGAPDQDEGKRYTELIEKGDIETDGTLKGSTIKEAVMSETAKQKANAREGFARRQADEAAKSTAETPDNEPDLKPLLAMTLVIRNKVNNRYVERPEDLWEHDKWEVEYALSEISSLESAHKLYKMTKARRQKTLTKSVDLSKANTWNDHFIASIKKMNEKGRLWREKEDKIEKKLPLKMLEIKEEKK